MDYQSIRAKIEAPLLTAYNSLEPEVPVYFDNVTAVPPGPPKEYVRINITFGLTTESVLAGSLDYARGALIIRCYAPKSLGPARCQQMVSIAKSVIDALNLQKKNASTAYVRIGQISGPSFDTSDDFPHFVGKISAGWQARAL